MNVPDWFWQGVVVNILTDALGLAIWLAWKHREKVILRYYAVRHRLYLMTLPQIPHYSHVPVDVSLDAVAMPKPLLPLCQVAGRSNRADHSTTPH